MKPIRLLLSVALLPFGCGQGGETPPGDTAASTPGRASATGAARPASASSGSSSGSSNASAPPTAPPPRVRLNVPAGTLLPIQIESTVSSDASREGDAVLAVLTEDVRLAGFTLDQGAEVHGRVLTVVPAKRVKGRARLVVAFDGVMENGEKLAIRTEPIDSLGASTSSKDKKIIGGGALGGLIVGAIKDGKKGAVVGTVIGAAAGTGAVLIMKGHEVEIPRGSKLTIAVTN